MCFWCQHTVHTMIGSFFPALCKIGKWRLKKQWVCLHVSLLNVLEVFWLDRLNWWLSLRPHLNVALKSLHWVFFSTVQRAPVSEFIVLFMGAWMTCTVMKCQHVTSLTFKLHPIVFRMSSLHNVYHFMFGCVQVFDIIINANCVCFTSVMR